MFDVSFFELAVVGLIALLALGPERLPGAARTLGALLRRARTSWFNLRNELERELDAEALRRPFGDVKREVEQPFDLLGSSLREVSQSLDPGRLSRKIGLLSDAPSTSAAVAAMGTAHLDEAAPAEDPDASKGDSGSGEIAPRNHTPSDADPAAGSDDVQR